MNEAERGAILEEARHECERLHRELGWSRPQADLAYDADARYLELQRETAREARLPYARPVDLGVEWDTGAPMPALIAAKRTFVAFYRNLPDPMWDGTPKMRDPLIDEGVGVIEFTNVTAIQMGGPNDEGMHSHWLWGSGLEQYRAHLVENSPRIEESERSTRLHYVLTFHDETVECLAGGAIGRTTKGTLSHAVSGLGSLSTRREPQN